MLAEFARHYWLPCDSPSTPPWSGERAKEVDRYRLWLVNQVEEAVGTPDLSLGLTAPCPKTVVRWQRFVFFEALAKMSEILYRGPITPELSYEVDANLTLTWRTLTKTIRDMLEFSVLTKAYRVSAVSVVMMLEAARPPELSSCEELDLPDARTLTSLLSLRSDKDNIQEILEMYRLVYRKLEGFCCPLCHRPFEESASTGLWLGDGAVVPIEVPKIFIPQCGHALHSSCFCTQLLREPQCSPACGRCRQCAAPYGWTPNDVDSLINIYCLMLGPKLDERAREGRTCRAIDTDALMNFVKASRNMSAELNEILSPASVWTLLIRRHRFKEGHFVDIIHHTVLDFLTPPPVEQSTSSNLGGSTVAPGHDGFFDEGAESEGGWSANQEDCIPLSPEELEGVGASASEAFLPDPEVEPPDVESQGSPESVPEPEEEQPSATDIPAPMPRRDFTYCG